MTIKSKRLVYCMGTAIGLLFSQHAFAEGTVAGTTVSNTATISYSVDGVEQDDVDSNEAQFVVDRRINLTVAELGGLATVVAPGADNQVTAFTVTNLTNFTQDFRLSVAQDATGATTAFGDTDSFNGANVRVFVDSTTTGPLAGVYDPSDTATFIDELAPDATRTVFVVVDIPAGQDDESVAGVILTATAAQAGGAANTLGADSTEDNGADRPMIVDTVFGDLAGGRNTAGDGKAADDDQYDVSAADIALVKSSKVLNDPFNLTVNPKAIPEAEVEYCIQIVNTGSAGATDLSLSDVVPAETTYKPGTLFTGGTVTGGVCNSDGQAEDDDATGADESDTNGAAYASAGTAVSGTFASVPSDTTKTLRFTVTVN